MSRPRVVNVTHLGLRPGDALPPGHVSIGHRNLGWRLRRSQWANPHPPEADVTSAARAANLRAYEAFVRRRPDKLEALPALAGQILCCWCAGPEGLDAGGPPVCHGQVLLRLLLEAGLVPAEDGR